MFQRKYKRIVTEISVHSASSSAYSSIYSNLFWPLAAASFSLLCISCVSWLGNSSVVSSISFASPFGVLTNNDGILAHPDSVFRFRDSLGYLFPARILTDSVTCLSRGFKCEDVTLISMGCLLPLCSSQKWSTRG